MTKDQIREFLKKNPQEKHRSRIDANMERIVFEEFGVKLEGWKIRKIVRLLRSFQEEIENDEKGANLEREWRAERGMQTGVELAEEALGRTIMVNGQLMRIRG